MKSNGQQKIEAVDKQRPQCQTCQRNLFHITTQTSNMEEKESVILPLLPINDVAHQSVGTNVSTVPLWISKLLALIPPKMNSSPTMRVLHYLHIVLVFGLLLAPVGRFIFVITQKKNQERWILEASNLSNLILSIFCWNHLRYLFSRNTLFIHRLHHQWPRTAFYRRLVRFTYIFAILFFALYASAMIDQIIVEVKLDPHRDKNFYSLVCFFPETILGYTPVILACILFVHRCMQVISRVENFVQRFHELPDQQHALEHVHQEIKYMANSLGPFLQVLNIVAFINLVAGVVLVLKDTEKEPWYAFFFMFRHVVLVLALDFIGAQIAVHQAAILPTVSEPCIHPNKDRSPQFRVLFAVHAEVLSNRNFDGLTIFGFGLTREFCIRISSAMISILLVLLQFKDRHHL